MMSLLQLGTLLERSFGTLRFLLLSVWSVLLCGALYVFSNWAISTLITSQQSQIYSSAVGYSGVLFSYALISSYHTTAPTQSVFGLFNVPSKIYPWILLGIMQVILPNISLLGHISGILVGLLTVYGPMELFFLPSNQFCKSIDDSSCCCGATKRSNYYATTNTNMMTDSCAEMNSSGFCSGLATFLSYGSFVLKSVWNIFAAILHILGCPSSVTSLSCLRDIFGRISSFLSRIMNVVMQWSYRTDSANSADSNFRSMQTSGGPSIGSQRPTSNHRYEQVSGDVEDGQGDHYGIDSNDKKNGHTINL